VTICETCRSDTDDAPAPAPIKATARPSMTTGVPIFRTAALPCELRSRVDSDRHDYTASRGPAQPVLTGSPHGELSRSPDAEGRWCFFRAPGASRPLPTVATMRRDQPLSAATMSSGVTSWFVESLSGDARATVGLPGARAAMPLEHLAIELSQSADVTGRPSALSPPEERGSW
jgi:hypothetical protein